MSNASLKDQLLALQAVASQFSDIIVTEKDAEKTHIPQRRAVEPRKQNQHPKQNLHKNKAPKIEKANASKPSWLVYVQYGVELLRAYFPQCFKSATDIKPLKKGIKQDLIKQLSTMEQIVLEDKACMVKSLSYYVNTAAYHKNVIEGALRIDLDGNPAGQVTAEEATYSIERHHAKAQVKQGATKANLNKPSQDQVEVI